MSALEPAILILEPAVCQKDSLVISEVTFGQLINFVVKFVWYTPLRKRSDEKSELTVKQRYRDQRGFNKFLSGLPRLFGAPKVKRVKLIPGQKVYSTSTPFSNLSATVKCCLKPAEKILSSFVVRARAYETFEGP